MIHTAKGFGIVNKAEIDVFLELSWFFDDPADVGNLISGSSAFSKTRLNIRSSRFTYCWSLAWRILSITLLVCEISAIDVQAGFRKGRGTRDQIGNIRWIMEKAREFQENNYFCFIDYAKAFDCVDHKKLWKILKEMGILGHLTCLLRNLYAGQEATIELDMEQQTGSK